MKSGPNHGLSKTSEYRSWLMMRVRCTNQNYPAYERYGARGISVCERWNEFTAFLEDMGPRPSKEHTLDRIDNNGNYEPDNCRWATRREQARNTRSAIAITHEGRTMVLAEWSRYLHLSPSTITMRMKSGMPIDKVLGPDQRYTRGGIYGNKRAH